GAGGFHPPGARDLYRGRACALVAGLAFLPDHGAGDSRGLLGLGIGPARRAGRGCGRRRGGGLVGGLGPRGRGRLIPYPRPGPKEKARIPLIDRCSRHSSTPPSTITSEGTEYEIHGYSAMQRAWDVELIFPIKDAASAALMVIKADCLHNAGVISDGEKQWVQSRARPFLADGTVKDAA